MRVIALVEGAVVRDLFLRLQAALKPLGVDFEYISPRLSTYTSLRRSGQPVFAITAVRETNTSKWAPLLADSQEIRAGSLTMHRASRFAASVHQALEKAYDRKPFDAILCWNGDRVADLAARLFAEQHDLPILHGELSNLPGKMQLDPLGPNGRSLLARQPELIDKLPPLSSSFAGWKDEIIRNRFKNHVLGQAKISNLLWPLDVLAAGAGWLPGTDQTSPKRLFRYLTKSSHGVSVHPTNGENQDYVFFPLQVSTDTQVLINSDIDNIEALHQADAIATSLNLPLYAKAHPAEHDPRILRQLKPFFENGHRRLVTGNTFQLLQNAREVVTINSTAGLEARLLGRPVHVLGRAVYRDLNDNDLFRYIEHYLVNIEVFSNEPISPEAARVVRHRLRHGMNFLDQPLAN